MTDYGVGAWRVPKTYARGMVLPDTTTYKLAGQYHTLVIGAYQKQRVQWGTLAIQKALISSGFLVADPNKLGMGEPGDMFGPKTQRAVMAFQKKSGLVADGAVGPRTARFLFNPWYVWWQAALSIPDNLLFGQARLESEMDPGAEGMLDPADRGIAQYNRKYHPDITDEIAFSNVPFCVMRAASDLRKAYDRLGDWKYAVGAHNNPKMALDWSRGMTPDPKIKRYVELVYERAAMPM